MSYEVKAATAGEIESLSEADARRGLAERSEFLRKVFDEAGAAMDHTKVQVVKFEKSADLAQWIRNAHADESAYGQRVSFFDEMSKAKGENERIGAYLAGKNGARPEDYRPTGEPDKPVFKTIGQLFVESEGYKQYRANRFGGEAKFVIEAADAKAAVLEEKTAFTRSAGWAPESLRTGRVVLDEQREIEVTQALPSIPTQYAAIKYMEETTFTNAAAERAEGGAYAENTFALTERSVTVETVGASLPTTDEQLEDEPSVAAYLDARMGFTVRQRLDSQILQGDGSTPNLKGTLNVAGINSQALGADPVLDAFYKGIVKCRVTGRSLPNVIFIHPDDFTPVRLLRTTEGIYIWGSPNEAGPDRMWGLPVVQTTAATEGTGIVGDYARFSALHVRNGLEIAIGYNNDDFTKGKKTIRAGLRVAVVHYRPSAFCQVTGI